MMVHRDTAIHQIVVLLVHSFSAKEKQAVSSNGCQFNEFNFDGL
jgi:hypothetical protein